MVTSRAIQRSGSGAADSRLGTLGALTDVVALTEEGSRAHQVVQSLGGRSLRRSHYTSTESAKRHLAARGASMVVIGGVDTAWLSKALHACREIGRFPIAMLVPEDTDASRSLMKKGATVLLDVHQPLDDIATRLAALGQSTAPIRGLDVRWLEADGLRLDLGARHCELNNERISLSLNEFNLLHFLMTHAQQVVPANQITTELWNIPGDSGLNTLRLNMARLRRKLGDSADAPTWIESVRRVGYQFIKPVAELGQERSEERLRHTVASLNSQQDGLFDLIYRLRSCHDIRDLAELAVSWATDRNFADAATVFRFEQRGEDRYSALVAAAGMSSRWRRSISRGHRVDQGFISSAAYLRGDVVQLADLSRPTGRFPTTVSMSSAEDLHACVILPLFRGDEVWGDFGLLSRQTRAFPPARVRYLRAASDLLSLTLGGLLNEEHSEIL